VTAESRPTRVDRLVAAIRGELTAEELDSDLAACIDAVRIMEAAYRSSSTGHWASVE